MTTERVERKLAAILSADVVSYGRLVGTDEEGTLARLAPSRVLRPRIAAGHYSPGSPSREPHRLARSRRGLLHGDGGHERQRQAQQNRRHRHDR